MPWRSPGRSFLTSGCRPDRSKPCSRQNCRRTAARVSAKVGRGLRYQASVQTAERARRSRRAASSVTIENRASRQGVVRAMARSDHRPTVVRPHRPRPALGLDAEMVAHLAEGDLHLPALDEPAHDLQRIASGIGAEQGLRVEALLRIAQQHPSASGIDPVPQGSLAFTPAKGGSAGPASRHGARRR